MAQAVEDRIVKAPLIISKEDDPKRPSQDPDRITRENVAEKYGYWLRAAVQRWREHWSVYRNLGTKPVLFIMVEKNIYADATNEAVLERPGLWLTRALVYLDNKGVDGVVNGLAAAFGGGSGRLRRLQTGFVRSYALSMMAGAFAVIAVLLAVRFS